jgi:hypothetical protein
VPLGWRNPSCRIRLIFRRARKRQFCTPSLFGAGTPHPLKNIIANTARPGALSVCSSVVELVFETEAGPSRLGRSGTRGRVGAGADRPYHLEAFGDVDLDLGLAAVTAGTLLRADINARCDVAADLQCRAAIRPCTDRQLFQSEPLTRRTASLAARDFGSVGSSRFCALASFWGRMSRYFGVPCQRYDEMVIVVPDASASGQD